MKMKGHIPPTKRKYSVYKRIIPRIYKEPLQLKENLTVKKWAKEPLSSLD